MNYRDMERKKEALIVLPPVQATADPEHQSRVRAITPLSKWQIERYSTPQPEYGQKELVDYWLHRNNIRVVERLPKIDPAVLTNRGTDVSKYFSFIHPVKFSLKVFSRENTQKKALMPPPGYSSLCPRLLRSQQRSEMEMFPRNPVIRVGGGYRRLSWKVLDILPSIGAYDQEFPPVYSCTSCHASLPVIEKVMNSRGQLRTILAAPKRCLSCGTPTTDYQAVKDGDLHESVRDTLHRGDSRFIVDHRKFEHSQIPSSNTKGGERGLNSSPIDWRDDLDSFRLHMSRQSQHDDGLETRDQSPDQKRSESGESVFITESEPSNNDVNKPPARRCAWDDGSSKADEIKEFSHQSEGSINGQGTGSYCSDNDHFSEFEMIEDYDPKSGFSVKLRRKPFGGSQKTNYFIHGIETEEATGQNPKAFRRKIGKHQGGGGLRRKHSSSPRHRSDRKLSPAKNQSTTYSPDRNGKELSKNGQLKEVISGQTKSSYTVGLDKRDYVFEDEPILIESDDDDDIFNPETRLSEEQFSNVEPWRLDPLRPSAALGTPVSPSADQPDGYLADSEENIDLSSLQAQIQKVRDQTKRHQKRKEDGNDESKTKIKEQKEIAKEFTAEERTPAAEEQTPEKDSAQKEDPLRNTQWDSDWDSDFSLHIQPFSDLSASSSEEEQWENGIRRNVNSAVAVEQQLGRNSDKINKDSLTTKEGAWRQEVPKRMLNAGAHDQVTETRNNKEANREERKQRRKIVVKPIPSLGPGSDSEDVAPRPRPRPVRDEGELSDSDLNFYKQQLQAPRRRKSQGNNQTSDDPVGCKGIDCYRCGAKIPECEGVCSKCGTWCQRPGGPCNACRDVCDRCGKPKYRCASVDENSEKSENEEEEVEDLSDSQESHHKPTPPLTNGYLQEQGESLIEENGKPDGDSIAETKKERKIRAPHERKKKDLAKVKRVRARRENTTLTEEGEQELDNSIVNDPMDKMDESVMNQESVEEDQPMESPLLAPSAVPLKSTRRSKPSKQVISQTVVYKEKHKPPKAEVTPEQEEDTQKEESFDTSPAQGTEAGVPGEEFILDGGEATESEIPQEDKNLAEETKIEEKNMNENDKADSQKEEEIVKEKEVQIKVESEEPQIQVEIKKKFIPKIRGVARVNAAFRERAELAKRLQTVLKEAISDVIGQADIKIRKDSSIDFLAQYRLVDRTHLEMYGRAFTLEDEDEDGIISYEQMLVAFEGVTSIAGMSRKQLMFVVKVMELYPGSRITFKMFSVTTALCEKVSALDEFVKRLVEDLDLFELECKLDFYRKMFFVTGDYSVNYITADQLRIELKAGGLNQSQEDHVIGHIMQSTHAGEISFLDYMAYLPLFLSMHKNICDNALDMSRNKYQRSHAT